MSVHSPETLDRIQGPHNWSQPTPWPGGKQPVPDHKVIMGTTRFGKQEPQLASAADWSHRDHHTDFVEYRISHDA